MKKRLNNTLWVLFAMSWNKEPTHFRVILQRVSLAFPFITQNLSLRGDGYGATLQSEKMSDPLELPRGRTSVRTSLRKTSKLHVNSYCNDALRKHWCGRRRWALSSPSPGWFSFCVLLAWPQASLKLRLDSHEPCAPSALPPPGFFVLWRPGSGRQCLPAQCAGLGEFFIVVKYT